MDPRITHVDSIFTQWDKPDSPGGALAVVLGGRVVMQRGYGCAHLEFGAPITPTTAFHVASVSKQFTAMATLLLEKDGKLSLRDDVREYVPELPDYGRVITLEHLMHHTSGLREMGDLLVLAGWRMSDLVTNGDALDAAFRQTRLSFLPGDEASYTNTGYILLATVVERVSGRSLREFTAERMFGPLGMTRTQFNDDHTRVVKNRACAYAPGADGPVISVPMFDLVGSTGLLTTVEDMVRWDQNFLEGTVGGESVLRWMETPARLNDGRISRYGGGLYMLPYRGLRTVQHAGGDAGYCAQYTRFPDQGLSVILLCNLATMPAGRLAEQVADVFLVDVLGPVPPRYTPDAGELALRAGLYWSPMSQGTLRLESVDGKLVVSLGGGEELGFVSPTEAEAQGAFARIEFPPSDGSETQTLQLASGPFPAVEYRRVPPASPVPGQLAEYAGAFHSPELRSTLCFSVPGDRLVLSRFKYPDAPLAPTFLDHFALGPIQVAFGRDALGHVDHLEIHTDRSRHLRFDRVR